MGWNYRVIHTTEAIGEDGADEDVYRIVEMFYEGDNDDKPNGWGEAGGGQAETPDELRDVVARMMKALDKPVIEVCGECHNIAPAHKPDCLRVPRLTVK